MRINHNISALKANNQLAKTNSRLDDSLEKLSSGLRINSAADDAAGLAISEKMRTQISGLDQASRNASDGISVIQTAEGALIEVESMLQRMRELAVQSANGTYTSGDRDAIQTEIDQLNKEITRISDTTEFNSMTLLDGQIDRKSYSNNNNVSLVSLSDTVSTGDYGVKITQDARQAVVLGNTTTFTGASTGTTISSTQKGSININGESVLIKEGDTIDEVFQKIRDACDNVDVNVFAVASTATPSTTVNLGMAGYTSKTLEGGDRLVFSSSEYGSDEKINIYCDNASLCDLLGLTTKGVSVQGYDAKAELEINSADSEFVNTATLSIKGSKVTVTDRNNFSMVFEVEPGTIGSTFTDATIISSSLDAKNSYPPNSIEIGTAPDIYGITVTQDARQAVIRGNVTPMAANAGVAATITINGTPVNILAADDFDAVLTKINAVNISTGIKAIAVAPNEEPSTITNAATAGYTALATPITGGNRILFVSDNLGSTASISIVCSDPDLAEYIGLSTIDSGAGGSGTTAAGIDAKVNLAYPNGTATLSVIGKDVTITDGVTVVSSTLSDFMAKTGFTDSTIVSPSAAATLNTITTAGSDITVSVLDAGPMDLQIGANEGQTMSVRIPKVTPGTLGIDKINVGTAVGAQEAIALLDVAINAVSAIRSKLGAYQNRLEHSISNLDTASENMTESLSRIEDVDMAEEMANYTQKNVLAQAGTSMLAQSNQRPQTILSLLQQ